MESLRYFFIQRGDNLVKLIENLPKFLTQRYRNLEGTDSQNRYNALFSVIEEKNRKSSTGQIKHAIYTTSMYKIIVYSWHKILKAIRGARNK